MQPLLDSPPNSKSQFLYAVTDTIRRRIPNAKPESRRTELRKFLSERDRTCRERLSYSSDFSNEVNLRQNSNKKSNEGSSLLLRSKGDIFSKNSRAIRSLRGRGFVSIETDFSIGVPYYETEFSKCSHNLEEVRHEADQSVDMGNKNNKSEESGGKSTRKYSSRMRFLKKETSSRGDSTLENINKSRVSIMSSQSEENESIAVATKNNNLNKKLYLPTSVKGNNGPNNKKLFHFQRTTNGKKDRQNIVQLNQLDSDCKKRKSSLPTSGNHKGTEKRQTKLDPKAQTSIESKISLRSHSKYYSPFYKKETQPSNASKSNGGGCIKNEFRKNENKASVKTKENKRKACGIFRSCSPCIAESTTTSMSSESMSSPSSSLSPTSPDSCLLISSSNRSNPSSSETNPLSRFRKPLSARTYASESNGTGNRPLLLKEKTFSMISNSSLNSSANPSILSFSSSNASMEGTSLVKLDYLFRNPNDNDDVETTTSPSESDFIELVNFASSIVKDDSDKDLSSSESRKIPLNFSDKTNAFEVCNSQRLSSEKEQSNSSYKSPKGFSKQTLIENNSNLRENDSTRLETNKRLANEKGINFNNAKKTYEMQENGQKKCQSTSESQSREEKLSKLSINLSSKLLSSSRNAIEEKSRVELSPIVVTEKSTEIDLSILRRPSQPNDSTICSSRMQSDKKQIDNLLSKNARSILEKFTPTTNSILNRATSNDDFADCNRVSKDPSVLLQKVTIESNPLNVTENSESSSKTEKENKIFRESAPLRGLSRDEGSAFSEEIPVAVDIKSTLLKGLNAGGLQQSSQTALQSKHTNLARKFRKIYTDWANHYLEKSRSKRHISDLQNDVTDGVILGDVIEAVTGQKVPDLNKKPKSSSQMLDNVSAALNFLGSLGVQLDGLTAKDIRDGNLKSILSLFFALSRYKQQQKQAHQERKELDRLREKKYESDTGINSSSRLGSPYNKGQAGGCGGSAIPTPALGGRKNSSDHHTSRGITSRSGTPSSITTSTGSQLKGIPSASSSRSASPSNGSFIPTPRSATKSSSHGEKIKQNGSNGNSRSSLRGVSSSNTKQKDSMLEKLKIFNKEKESKSKSSNNSGVSKRTSSSSGFSSARSERSDSSSTSLCSDTRPPPPLPPHQNLPASTSSSSSDQAIGYPEHSSGKSPGLRGIRSRLSRSSKDGKESPKSGRRSEDRESSKGSPKSSHRHRNGEAKESRTHETRKPDNLYLNLNSKGSQMVQTDATSRTSKVASVTNSSNRLAQKSTPSSPQSSNGLVSCTGIPKPTAAVKGTTKPISPASPNVNTPTVPKDYQNKMSKPNSALRKPPIGCEAPPKQEGRDPKGSLPRQRNLGRREDGASPSVAMVSPMPQVNGTTKAQVSASESGSALSEASHASGHSNSSGNSSVIFKPTSSEDEVAYEQRMKAENESMLLKSEGEDVVLDIKPMQPIARASQYGYIRGLGQNHVNGRTLTPSFHTSNTSMPENSNTVPQKGMKMMPNHFRREPPNGISRINQGYIISTEYSDLECIDLATGYLSDGEVLRPTANCNTYPGTDLDGYLSEGGASMYALKLNQRLQEGMRQVHESMNKVQHFIQDDSFDDSSSLSSGVSDTLNELSEDLLSSSLSSEQTTALAKARGAKDVGLKLPVGLSGPSPRKAAMGMDPSGAYRVVSSKAHVKKTENTQQTEPFKQISNTQWKKYVDAGKPNFNSMGEYQRGLELHRKADIKRTNIGHSPSDSVLSSNGRKPDKKVTSKERIGIGPIQVNGDSKKIANPKMVPANFGYKKIQGSPVSGSNKVVNNRKDLNSPSKDGASNSLDRPKTKLKVSGGTQTTSDLQFMPNAGFHSDGEYSSNSLGRKYQSIKSYSLNGPAAAQLSQGVRERILQSPYRKVHMGTAGDPYAAGVYYRERSPRMKVTDGSLSDSPYSNYAEVQYGVNPYGNTYSWMPRNNYASSVVSAPAARHLGGSLTEAESMESLSSSNSSFAQQLQHARANNLTQARLMMHQREMSTSPRLARSNSVRSTKSEKILGLREGYHSSQPTSPTPLPGNRLPMSPLNTARGSPYYSGAATRPTKDDECHGSTLSLVSSSSSLYSSQEDKHAAEVRKLKRDLTDAQDRVITLTNQLTTNAHVVAAFEQSLTNMTNRLQHLTATSEQKDSELTDLRRTIDSLRQQSIDAGLTMATFQSMSKKGSLPKAPKDTRTKAPQDTPTKGSLSPNNPATKPPPHPHPPSNNASCSALNVLSSPPTKSLERTTQCSSLKSPEFARRHTFTGTCRDIRAREVRTDGGNLVRGSSAESVSSLSSACSGTSHTSLHDKSDNSKSSSKKKGWLRSSFTKAFSRGHKGKQKSFVSSDAEDYKEGDLSIPPSPQPNRNLSMDDQELLEQNVETDPNTNEEVVVLKRQLWEKDMVLTDIRLEALTSAHQLESLKETLTKMRSEMKCLKEDNDRLQRVMVTKSLSSSRSSIPISEPVADHRLSVSEDIITIDDTTDVLLIDPLDKDSKRCTISVYLGCHGDHAKYKAPSDGSPISECVIGAISISGKTKWDTLDSLVKRIFKEFLIRVDPASNLGINSDSILTYHLGEVTRGKNGSSHDLLPCGYLVGEVSNIQIVLKGSTMNCVDALAFETLNSKSIIQRYISLLTEHRRIILSGSTGTGKTFLAQKLAEYLVSRMCKDPSPENIATFSVDHKSSKDLGAYLSHVSDQCENNAADLPLVIILDNLHYAGSLTDVFNGFLSAKYTQCPFIIGTMIQATSCSTTNLQLHHNFRWVLMANHMEPVKGLLAKVTRRKLTQVEVETFTRQTRLQQVLDWLPKCWSHINKFLETHSSSDVTIGPSLFLSCPGSVEGSQVWFTDLWNYSLVPYLVEAVREGLQLYGKRASWEDPTQWINETYPWPTQGTKPLVSLRPDDVGYDSVPASNAIQEKNASEMQSENDPLLSMLMRLQEAANFSSPQQDTASVSIENIENALESTL